MCLLTGIWRVIIDPVCPTTRLRSGIGVATRTTGGATFLAATDYFTTKTAAQGTFMGWILPCFKSLIIIIIIKLFNTYIMI